jgi:hypothetical protein
VNKFPPGEQLSLKHDISREAPFHENGPSPRGVPAALNESLGDSHKGMIGLAK